MDEKRGRHYERLVAALQLHFDPQSDVTHDERVTGRDASQQIDVVIRGKLGRTAILIVIECRDTSRKIKKHDMQAFVTVLKDVGANKGIMVTRVGYDAGALATAYGAGIDTCVLRPASDKDWNGYLRSIQVTMIDCGMAYHDCKVRLRDGSEIAVSKFTRFRLPESNDQPQFFDHLINYAMTVLPWSENEVFEVQPAEPLLLCRDLHPEPEVAALICRPCSEEFAIVKGALWSAPEDWVFFKMLPDGQVDEKEFLQFRDLDEMARQFNG